MKHYIDTWPWYPSFAILFAMESVICHTVAAAHVGGGVTALMMAIILLLVFGNFANICSHQILLKQKLSKIRIKARVFIYLLLEKFCSDWTNEIFK